MNKKNFFWNMMGSGVYALATILFVMIAKRVVGETAGAAFYMAFTTGQMLLTIGYFEIRPFQVTDQKRQYSAPEYLGFRIITCAIMMLGAFVAATIYLVAGKADIFGFILIIVLSGYKMFDGLADVFEGEFQRNDRIDVSGKSMTFRTLAAIVIFTFLAYITRNIYIASVGMMCVCGIGVAAIALAWSKGFEKVRVSFEKSKMMSLFNSTILLFLGSAMCMWIWNGTKYVVEWTLTPKETLVYGIVFMPTMVINLGSGFLFKPMLTTLARHYDDKNSKAFVKLLGILSGWIAIITLVTLVAAYLLGIPVLGLLYDMDLTAYKAHMMILIVAGGFNALGIILYYALTTMRKQLQIFVGYIVAFIAGIILPVVMTGSLKLMGASLSYLLVMVLLTIVFAVMTAIDVMKMKR